ncbi:MAG: hypothetical protein K1X72_21640 [Pyrinomonadaceae bacterium]|nr:hypothetical protein [Pyrinomonadaceae bacterium]
MRGIIGFFLNFNKKTNLNCYLYLVLFLSIPTFTQAQSSATKQTANKSWNSFWTKFKTAVNTKDRKSLILLTSKRFFSPSGETIGELLNKNDWRWLKNSVKNGTKPHKCQKLICRRTRNSIVESSLVFVFENNRWGFIGQLGE